MVVARAQLMVCNQCDLPNQGGRKVVDKSVTLGEKERLGAEWEQKRLLRQLPLT